MSDAKFFEVISQSPKFVYKLVHEGKDYVIGFLVGKEDTYNEAAIFRSSGIVWVDNPDAIKVGDYVRPRFSKSELWMKVIYIHQNTGDNRRWIVYAYEGDIPQSKFPEELVKKVD